MISLWYLFGVVGMLESLNNLTLPNNPDAQRSGWVRLTSMMPLVNRTSEEVQSKLTLNRKDKIGQNQRAQ